jgi:hypothetical protein
MSKGRTKGKTAVLLRDYDTGTTKVLSGTQVWLSGEVDEHFWVAYLASDGLGSGGPYLGLIPEDVLRFAVDDFVSTQENPDVQ